MHEYGEGEKRKHITKARLATKKLCTTSLCKLSTYFSALIEFVGKRPACSNMFYGAVRELNGGHPGTIFSRVFGVNDRPNELSKA